jgi:RHS repeat-associated protein
MSLGAGRGADALEPVDVLDDRLGEVRAHLHLADARLGLRVRDAEASGHAPCGTLPEGVVARLIYNQSGNYIDFGTTGRAYHIADRYGNKLTAGFKEGSSAIATWTDTQGRKFESSVLSSSPTFYTEVKDVTGERHINYGYEGEGTSAQLTSYTDAVGTKTYYHYDAEGDLNKITTPKGNVVKLVYDTSHRIKEIIRTTNSEHTTGPTTKFTYYEVGSAPSPCTSTQKATVVKDPDWTAAKAHETTYCSNILDEVEKTVNAEGQEAQATFDPFGNALSSMAPARETGGSPGVTSTVYGEAGQNLNCEITGTTGLPKTECPTGALSQGYSTRNKYTDATYLYQPSETISERQKAATNCYWGGSNTCTVPEGESGPNGALKQQTDPLSSQNKLNYSYNTNGTISSSTDALGHKTTYEYDTNGNLKTIIPPSGSGLGKETITVDADSRPHIITQCLVESGGSCTSSQTATLTYGKLDRLLEAVDTGPGATKTFKYTYDVDGNLETREDPTGTTSFSYDSLNRLTAEWLPGSTDNEYSYDEASNLLSFGETTGTVHYFHNGLNKMYAMYLPGGNCSGTPSKCTEASYDGDGTLTKVKYASGATLNYSVDPTTGRPTAITLKNPGGETLLSHAYTYTSSGNDTPLIFKDVYSQPGTATNTTEYEYDALDRLVEAATTGTNKSRYQYTLDGAGNRTSQQVNTSESTGGPTTYYRYNTGNELECRMKTNEACSKSSSSEISGYSYDGAGNETAITGYNDPASTTFTYNNLSQLKTLTPPSESAKTTTYLGSGQSNLTGLGTTTLQNSLVGTIKQTSESETSYYARTPSGLMVAEILPSSSEYNPIYDSNGDIIGLLNSSGALVQTLRYGPYGENANAAGSLAYGAISDAFLFQGGYHLVGGNAGAGSLPNDLYHYGERFYDPTSGRWSQPDPLNQGHNPRQLGRYSFAADDPVNQVDPGGEVSRAACWATIILLSCGGEADENFRASPFRYSAGKSAYEERPTVEEPKPDPFEGDAGDESGADGDFFDVLP